MLNISRIISKQRTQLMGVCIIAVFACHIYVFATIPSESIKSILRAVTDFGFTDGFLFLSGFGIFFSLSKDENLTVFYKRRIKKLYIPYLFIAAPFLVLITLYSGGGWLLLCSRLLTIDFWINGNFYSMWYVSVLAVLYLISPFLYSLIQARGAISYLKGIAIVIIMIAFFEYKRDVYGEFGNFKFITQMPAYIYGMLAAKLLYEKSSKINLIFVCLILALPFVFILVHFRFEMLCYYQTFVRLINLGLIALLFEGLNNSNSIIGRTMTWFGQLSLELYLTHMLIFWLMVLFFPDKSTIIILTSILIALLISKPISIVVDKIIKRI